MKLSLNWIKQYVELPHNLTPEQLSYDLTMRTVEVEEIIDLSAQYRDIVVGKILTVENHSNADMLKVCKVDLGKDKIYQIVCGGKNLYENQLVIVALPGSYIKWHGEGDLVQLEETQLRGEISQGMICSSKEIGLENIFIEEEQNITDITEYGYEVGKNIADVLGLNDYIIDIDNKSLTNRPDLWSHYGIARELAAIYNVDLINIEDQEFIDYLNLTDKPKYNIVIEAEDLCKRFVGIVVDDVSFKETPIEIKILLNNIGEKSVNLLVDISNYIMFALGQPMHFYDYDKIVDGIIVRKAINEERIFTLNNEELVLNSNNLVIADKEKILGLAGIIGAKDYSVTEDTKKIVIEIANFDALNIRTTSQELNQRTESSIRFEKNIDIQRIDLCFNLLFKTLRKYYPNIRILEYMDARASDLNDKVNIEIEVKQSFLDKRLGKKIDKENILSHLEKLGFTVEFDKIDDDILYNVFVPSWRATGDVSLKEDIVEEIGRMEGYENFETLIPKVDLNPPIIQKEQDVIRRIKEYLSFRCDMQEIKLYPFIHEKYIDAIGIDKSELLNLTDPPSPEMRFILNSLLPGVLSAIEINLKNYDEFNIYEVGRVFFKNHEEILGRENLPIQPRRLTGAIVGKNAKDIFLKTKGIIENMSRNVQIGEFELLQIEEVNYLDKKAYLNILANSKVIGVLGLLSKKTMIKSGIKNMNVCVFDINLDELQVNSTRENRFEQLSQHPLVKIDLSILIDESVKWEEIREIVLKTADKVEFVEEYKGEQVPEGHKSIMFHMIYDGKDRTLVDQDIKERTSKIISDLNNIGASIRE